jgi:uncharacterized protein with HEPN domain
MSKRDVRLFLSDMLEAIEKIERYTAGLSLRRSTIATSSLRDLDPFSFRRIG